jgi:hypothetical protein
MKRSARTVPPSTATNVAGSAFAARKHDSVQSSSADENGDNPASEDFDTLESTESDDGFEFSNSFDALRRGTAAVAPPEKKVRRNVGVNVPPAGALSTCEHKRMNYLEDERAIKVTLLPDEVVLHGDRVYGRLLRYQEHSCCVYFKGVSRFLERDSWLRHPIPSTLRKAIPFHRYGDSNLLSMGRQ